MLDLGDGGLFGFVHRAFRQPDGFIYFSAFRVPLTRRPLL